MSIVKKMRGFQTTNEMWEQFGKLAQDMEMSKSALIRYLIERALNQSGFLIFCKACRDDLKFVKR